MSLVVPTLRGIEDDAEFMQRSEIDQSDEKAEAFITQSDGECFDAGSSTFSPFVRDVAEWLSMSTTKRESRQTLGAWNL